MTCSMVYRGLMDVEGRIDGEPVELKLFVSLGDCIEDEAATL